MKSIFTVGILSLTLAASPLYLSLNEGTISLDQASAYAAGKSGGAGNSGNAGNGGNKGNSGNVGKSANAGNSGKSSWGFEKSSSKRTKTFSKMVGQARAEFAKTWASRFGGLNAFRANANAYANANPDSQVGRINTYKETTLAAAALAADLEEAVIATQLANQALVDFGLTQEQIDAYGLLTDELEIAAAIEAYALETGETVETITAAFETLAGATQTQADLAEEVEGLEGDADEAFAAAATKEASDEVREELDNQLGLTEQE